MAQAKKTNISWYPGHMEKARRQMQEQIKSVDVVIEICDARLPYSSRNPIIEHLAQGKGRLLILNKSDRADREQTKKWLEYFKETELNAISLNTLNEDVNQKVMPILDELLKEKREKALKRGIRNKAVRAMIVGIPNVGKSTFINKLAGSKLKVENRPGVTRELARIQLNNGLQILDTPGVLWPKLDEEEVALKLALIGSLNDQVLNLEDIASFGINYLQQHYPHLLKEIYNCEAIACDEVLKEICEYRRLLQKDGEPDYDKGISTFLKDIRNDERLKVSYDVVE